jgi:hypothetical protein
LPTHELAIGERRADPVAHAELLDGHQCLGQFLAQQPDGRSGVEGHHVGDLRRVDGGDDCTVAAHHPALS